MNVFPFQESRPEAMADVAGACELPLTRAVVQYRDVHEVDTPGGRIQDIGLALVLEGRYASSAEVLDLGSGDVKLLDLSQELVVLDWVYEPTLEHVTALVRAAAETGSRDDLERFAWKVGLQVLERVGFSPLSRPSLLRLGFRDLCRDLDLHEGTSVRILMGGGRLFRVHMDYDGNALVAATPTAARDVELEEALATAFPLADVRRIVPASPAAAGGYQVRFSVPQSLDELRGEMDEIRGGLLRLLARFEPGRLAQLEAHLATFGERETLARFRSGRAEPGTEPVPSAVPHPGTVH
jgi:hypothetical protein